MNHRQWKKKFKKDFGRNPNWFEDKKKSRKFIKKVHELFIGFDLAKMGEEIFAAVSYTAQKATEALKKAFEVIQNTKKEQESENND